MIERNNAWKPEFRKFEQAFADAISAGSLSEDHDSDRYAGQYMYMYSSEGYDYFKNSNTRRYIRSARPGG